jgi:hypothetical protein
MLEDFNQAAADCRKRGSVAFACFVIRELTGLLRGLLTEWMAKWTANSSYLAACTELQERSDLPLEVVAVQERLQFILRRMEFAIAHHDFPKARLYCDEERITRAHLERLLSHRKPDQPFIPFSGT